MDSCKLYWRQLHSSHFEGVLESSQDRYTASYEKKINTFLSYVFSIFKEKTVHATYVAVFVL